MRCKCFIPKQKRKEPDPKSDKGLMLYCYDNSKYKVWINTRQTVVKARYLSIEESERPCKKWFPNGNVPVPEDSESRETQLLRRNQRMQILRDHMNLAPYFQYSLPQDGREDENTTDVLGEDSLTYYPPPHSREKQEGNDFGENNSDTGSDTVENGLSVREGQQNKPEGSEYNSNDETHADADSRYPRRQRTHPDFYSPASAMTAHVLTKPSNIAESQKEFLVVKCRITTTPGRL